MRDARKLDQRSFQLPPTHNHETIDRLSDSTEFSVSSEDPSRTRFNYETHCHEIREPSVPALGGAPKFDGSNIIDHVYEEVNAVKEQPGGLLEYDIVDYYEKYSPTTAKTLINTLFLPRQRICKRCASRPRTGPVFTDPLVYSGKRLLAREVRPFYQQDALSFRYCHEVEEEQERVPSLIRHEDKEEEEEEEEKRACMLVHGYSKTNGSSIFYSHGPPRDVFDLETALKPSILLLSSSTTTNTVSSLKEPGANTELYHRSVNEPYGRVSRLGTAPMRFRSPGHHQDTPTTTSSSLVKRYGSERADLQNWTSYRTELYQVSSGEPRLEETIDHRANRSSLLLLEPLLLMPELASTGYNRQPSRHTKNRVSRSEHVKIARIVLAYTLSFLILASITFYIVYFT